MSPRGPVHTGDWSSVRAPVVLLGDNETGKRHVPTGLAITVYWRSLRVRYATSAAVVVNILVETQDELRLSKMVGRYGQLDLLCLNELGYLQLDRPGVELLFQILTGREATSTRPPAVRA